MQGIVVFSFMCMQVTFFGLAFAWRLCSFDVDRKGQQQGLPFRNRFKPLKIIGGFFLAETHEG